MDGWLNAVSSAGAAPATLAPVAQAGAARAQAQAQAQASPAQPAQQAAQFAEVQEVEEVCQPCEDKWLVITIERNTKHQFGGRWDCTLGDLKMEIWEEEHSGSGALVFECKTSERGGPANADFFYNSNGPGYSLHNQYMIMPSEDYGLSAPSTSNYKTYRYRTDFPTKPRPGIAIYGSGPGAMDRRTGVLIHAGSHHRWSVGCIVLHLDGAVANGRYEFNATTSYNTLLTFLRKIHEFTGVSSHGTGVRIANVRLIVRENF